MLKFTITQLDFANVLTISGEMLDRFNTLNLRQKMDEAFADGKRFWIINLNGLNYLNSEGLGILVSIFTKARNLGGEVVICNVSDELKKLFIMTKLNKIFKIENTEDSALDFLKSVEKNYQELNLKKE